MAKAATEEGKETRKLAPRDVKRDFEVFDNLPPRPPRPSVLEDALQEVKNGAPGKWVCIAKYKNAPAATGAANNLRDRHGSNAEADGWTIKTRKVDEGRTGLFVHYDESQIVPGVLEQHVEVVAQRREEAKRRREEKKAQEQG